MYMRYLPSANASPWMSSCNAVEPCLFPTRCLPPTRGSERKPSCHSSLDARNPYLVYLLRTQLCSRIHPVFTTVYTKSRHVPTEYLVLLKLKGRQSASTSPDSSDDSQLRQYHLVWQASVSRVLGGLKGLGPASPQDTWGTERAESHQSIGYPGGG